MKVKNPGLKEGERRAYVINLTLKLLSTGNWEIPESVPHCPSWPLVSHSSHSPLPTPILTPQCPPASFNTSLKTLNTHTQGHVVERGNPVWRDTVCAHSYYLWTWIPLCDSIWKESCKTHVCVIKSYVASAGELFISKLNRRWIMIPAWRALLLPQEGTWLFSSIS